MAMNTSRRTTLILQVVFVVLLCVGLGIAAYALGIFKPPAGYHNVSMRIESSGGYAQITYKTARVSVNESTTVNTPWTQSYLLPKDTEVILTAANPSQSGSVSCTIKLDGQPWKDDSAVYPRDHVACAGLIP